MKEEQTLSIIKPDAVSNNLIGQILARFEKAGLKIVAAKMVHLNIEQAKAFYAVHAARPFYMDLVTFMTEGPVLVTVLEGPDAVAQNRAIMGATNPKDAAPGTLRKDFAESIDRNVVHGSDSAENAKKEIEFFFRRNEIFSCKPQHKCCCC
jgi:nucleoside-diphosphate kinase